MQMHPSNLPNVQRARRLRRDVLSGVRQMHETAVYGIGETYEYGFDANEIIDEMEKDIAQIIRQLEYSKEDLQKYRTPESQEKG